MVLNKTAHRITPATQRLVEEAARKLGYFPNFQARSLRLKRTRSIGILIFDVVDPYCTAIYRGIENSLGDAGYRSVLADLRNMPQRLKQCTQMLMERRVEGLIAIVDPSHLRDSFSMVMKGCNIPAVIIGGQPANRHYPSVGVDIRASTRLAVEHLYDLGHRKIAVIRGPKAKSDSSLRWDGIRKCAAAKGIPIDRTLLAGIESRNSSYEEGYQLTELLLRKGKRFSALIAFDDLTAFAAIGALSNAGLRVPEDCSVIGFDDIPGAAFYNPPLTTVCHYTEKQGAIGAEIMCNLLNNENGRSHKGKRVIIEPHLVIRKSTARAPSTCD